MANSPKTCKNLCTAIIAFVLLFAAASCERSQEPPTPFKATAVNDVEIKSVYITDKKFGCPFNIILPSDYKTSGKKYPVLYLLHGILSDNHSWQKSGNVVELTQKAVNDGVIAPFIIVLPNAYMTFYVDDLDWSGIPVFEIYPKLRFESFFTKELQPYIEKYFPVMTDREHTGHHTMHSTTLRNIHTVHHSAAPSVAETGQASRTDCLPWKISSRKTDTIRILFLFSLNM